MNEKSLWMARMAHISFLPEAWEDYVYWQGQDKKTLKKINQLLRDICRERREGIGQAGTAHRQFIRLVETPH